MPKKIQKMGNLFYGLLSAVNEAMDAGNRPALEQALRRNLFDGAESAPAVALAGYLEDRDRALADHPIADIVGGRLKLEQAA